MSAAGILRSGLLSPQRHSNTSAFSAFLSPRRPGGSLFSPRVLPCARQAPVFRSCKGQRMLSVFGPAQGVRETSLAVRLPVPTRQAIVAQAQPEML